MFSELQQRIKQLGIPEPTPAIPQAQKSAQQPSLAEIWPYLTEQQKAMIIQQNGVNTQQTAQQKDINEFNGFVLNPNLADNLSMTASANKDNGRKDVTPSVSESNTATLFHGANGLFADCALQRDIISSMVTPSGVLARLPAIGTNVVETKVGLLTGYDPDGAPEPNFPCEDAPSGTYAACVIDFNWGRVARQTQTIEFDEVIKRKDNADVALTLRGQLLGRNQQNGRLSMRNLNTAQMLNIVVLSEMVGVGIALERNISRVLWQGDPANNTANNGYMEPTGLDGQITTGIVDSGTLVPCPAVDSQILDWALSDVCVDPHPTLPGNQNIVDAINDMEHYLHTLANDAGLSPVTWAIVMHPSLWYNLTECWPCKFATNRCETATSASSGNVVVQAPYGIDERDRMRRDMMLPVNGRMYPVWVDDGVFEDDSASNPLLNPGEYASSIYFLPLTIRGGFPVSYIEYQDYRSTIAMREVNAIAPRNMFWSDDGVFSWTIEQVKWCFKLAAKTEWRPILRTPHLAGKIENVMYTPRRKVRSPYPGDPTYIS